MESKHFDYKLADNIISDCCGCLYIYIVVRIMYTLHSSGYQQRMFDWHAGFKFQLRLLRLLLHKYLWKGINPSLLPLDMG